MIYARSMLSMLKTSAVLIKTQSFTRAWSSCAVMMFLASTSSNAVYRRFTAHGYSYKSCLSSFLPSFNRPRIEWKTTNDPRDYGGAVLQLSHSRRSSSHTTTKLMNDNLSSHDRNSPSLCLTNSYQPSQPPLSIAKIRQISSSSSSYEWTVPKTIPIPEDQLEISFSRSSGAGGQNVNKVNTKADIRFHIDSSSWIPLEVRERLKIDQAHRINNEGYFILSSQEHRTQLQNKREALQKVENILKESWGRPKVRKMREGLSVRTKESRREMKKQISEKKANRKNVDF